MAGQVREGGCGCGHVRYHTRGEPIMVNNCHCTQCQHQTGSTSVVNAFFETDRFTLLAGELTRHVVASGSGGAHEIVRCAQCGVAVYSHYPRFGRLGLGVRVGTLDNSSAFTPDAVLYVSEKMPWAALPEGIPAFEKNYDHREVLPPERFERLAALARRAEAAGG